MTTTADRTSADATGQPTVQEPVRRHDLLRLATAGSVDDG